MEVTTTGSPEVAASAGLPGVSATAAKAGGPGFSAALDAAAGHKQAAGGALMAEPAQTRGTGHGDGPAQSSEDGPPDPSAGVAVGVMVCPPMVAPATQVVPIVDSGRGGDDRSVSSVAGVQADAGVPSRSVPGAVVGSTPVVSASASFPWVATPSGSGAEAATVDASIPSKPATSVSHPTSMEVALDLDASGAASGSPTLAAARVAVEQGAREGGTGAAPAQGGGSTAPGAHVVDGQLAQGREITMEIPQVAEAPVFAVRNEPTPEPVGPKVRGEPPGNGNDQVVISFGEGTMSSKVLSELSEDPRGTQKSADVTGPSVAPSAAGGASAAAEALDTGPEVAAQPSAQPPVEKGAPSQASVGQAAAAQTGVAAKAGKVDLADPSAKGSARPRGHGAVDRPAREDETKGGEAAGSPARGGEGAKDTPTGQASGGTSSAGTYGLSREPAKAAGGKVEEEGSGRLAPVAAGRADGPGSANPAGGSSGGERAQQLDGDLFEQLLANAAKLRAPRDGSLRVQLKPPSLGYLDMRLGLRDGVLTLQILAESERTRDMIQSALPQLRHALEGKAIEVGQMSLGTTSAGPGSWQGGPADPSGAGQWQGRRYPWTAPRASPGSEPLEEPPRPRGVDSQVGRHLVDYLV